MRVTRFRLSRLHDEERGATLAIVAISLICLLGMLVLTFDLGSGVAIKRNMVNAADSGALAAAMECGRGNGPAIARAEAEELVVDNNGAAEVIGFELAPGAQCGPGSTSAADPKNEVTVTVRVPHEYYFAQIFGFDQGAVVATATAEWTYGISNPAPLRLESMKVDECLTGGPGSSCYFKFESDGQGQWGWLNFPEGWPVEGGPNPATCTSAKGGTNDLVEYIRGMGLSEQSSFLPTLWNIPIWACAFNGEIDQGQQEITEWIDTVGMTDPRPVVYFPVVAPPPPGPCPAEGCWQWYTGSRASYPIIRFQGFYFEDLFSGQELHKDAALRDACGFDHGASWGSVFCIELSLGDADSDPSSGHPLVRLVG
jgi:hypothetical protein